MIKIIRDKITCEELKIIADEIYGNLIKAVVDIKLKIMAVGGELHADEEALLLEKGSKQENLWGVNLYPDKFEEELIEFDSIINIRPSQKNLSRGVENNKLRKKIKETVLSLIK